MRSQIEDLRRLCKLFGYELIVDASPHLRPDALGNTDLPGAGEAQLCRNKTIAVNPSSTDLSYIVSHELAHGRIGFCDEKDVLYEQTSILAHWVNTLLREIKSHGSKRTEDAESAGE